MTAPAEQHEIRQDGRPALGPVLEMMAVGPLRRAIAAAGHTGPIPGLHRPPGGRGDAPRGVADFGFQLAPTRDAGERGIAGQSPDSLPRHQPANFQFASRGTGRSQQGVQAGPDDQMGPRPGAGG